VVPEERFAAGICERHRESCREGDGANHGTIDGEVGEGGKGLTSRQES